MSDLKGLTEPLTEREREILACLCEGISNRAIASRLHLAYETVKWYNTQIYSKLGVNNRDDAIARATALGLLENQSEIPQPAGKHNLPVSITEFVGRKQEIHDLLQLLADDHKRLITILAPGGMGKTRLAQAVARTQIRVYRDGVYFVPLAPLSSSHDIVTTIAENIGFIFHGDQPPEKQLVNFLKDRHMLLVLDNFEHLLAAAERVSNMIQSTPNIRIIVTSRERLNLRGENVYNLRGLQFPTWETPQDALEYDAVKLFMQSAHRVRSDFELRSTDLDFLARICRLTAGMPLGIELAAGWIDVLSLEQIAREIQRGIDIFETDMRDVPERHRSLRATFEQTWHRLNEAEQLIFARLSVFRGGFTFESATRVADATVYHLRKLLQKSLIQTEPDERFEIHELLRQFGEEKLASLDMLSDTRIKHAQYFADFMIERKRDIKGNQELEALAQLEHDFENVRVAWWYWVEHHEWEQLPKFLFGLYWYGDARALDPIIIQMIELAIQMMQSVNRSPSVELALARVKPYIGWFYKNQGVLSEVQTLCNDAIPILARYESTEDLIFAYNCLAMTYSMKVQPAEAIRELEAGYKLAEISGDRYWQGRLLVLKARQVAFHDYEASLNILDRAKSILEKLDNHMELSHVYDARSFIVFGTGDFQQAQEYLLPRRQLIAPFQMPYADADDLGALGQFALREGDYKTARQYLYQSLDIFWDAGYVIFTQRPLFWIAQLFFYEGKFEQALALLANLYTQPSDHNYVLDGLIPGFGYDVLYDELKSSMEQHLFDTIWEQGQAQDLRDIIISVLSDMKDDE